MEEIVLYYIAVGLISYFGLFTTVFFIMTFIEYKKKLQDPYVNPTDKNLPKVSILVPAYNEEKAIVRTIKSLQELNYPKDKVEIMVIDDGSNDRTYELSKKLAKEDSRIIVYTKQNGGKGSALNYGIAKAKGEFIISMDADSFASKDALIHMIGYFQDKKVMAVTPSMTLYKPK